MVSVVVVTETLCSESANNNSLLKIPNYKRRNEQQDRGLCFLFIKL